MKWSYICENALETEAVEVEMGKSGLNMLVQDHM